MDPQFPFPLSLSLSTASHPSFPHPPCLSGGGLFIGSVSGRRLCLSCVPSRMHPSNTHTDSASLTHTRAEAGLSILRKRNGERQKEETKKRWENDEKGEGGRRRLWVKLYIIDASPTASALICHPDPMRLVDMCRRCRRSC